jgi:hypothetical protein
LPPYAQSKGENNGKKRVLLAVLALTLGATVFAQTNERKRGFYLDIGIYNGIGGMVSPMYEGVLLSIMPIDLCIGWALRQNLYLVADGSVLVGVARNGGDMTVAIISNGEIHKLPPTYPPSKIKTYEDEIDTDSFFGGLDVKLYPLPSQKYLQLGASFGYCSASLRYTQHQRGKEFDGSDDKDFYRSFENSPPLGLKLSVAYGFDSTMTGWAALLGAETIIDLFENRKT